MGAHPGDACRLFGHATTPPRMYEGPVRRSGGIAFLCMTNLCLVVQEEKLKRPLSHMQAWEIAHTRKDPKPGEPKYYGKKTVGRKKAYSEGYLALHPDTPDPIAADLDERVVVLDVVITPSISYTQLRRIDPTLSQRTSTRMSSAPSLSLFQEQQTAYMEYTRQETMAWHDRLHAYHQQRDREIQHTFQEMAAGRCPQWPSAEGPPAQPVLLTFEEFVAQNAGPSPGTGASTVGGGLRNTPETRSPTTPIHGDGGGGGRGGGLGGSAAASSDDLGFGGLGGDDLRGAQRPGA
ncbi:uncharacterized protein [Aegilops tauschii subsp. strangulata]|uniref:uncharacterized protein n=1 Tax=Aegilops tauschii subsp. strangulata TaxID=200361 RepID=UPI001E1CAB3E|nr:uncharacterized protein LOC120967370 [Aegilops tauschii subsp. strangulata]